MRVQKEGTKAGALRMQVRWEQDVAGPAPVAVPGAAVGQLPPGGEGRSQRAGNATQQGGAALLAAAGFVIQLHGVSLEGPLRSSCCPVSPACSTKC